MHRRKVSNLKSGIESSAFGPEKYATAFLLVAPATLRLAMRAGRKAAGQISLGV